MRGFVAKSNFFLIAALCLSVAAWSAGNDNTIDLAQKPLAVESKGVSPNIMLLIDDSGSMACGVSKKCGDDVFYAPGYDANQEYSCKNSTDRVLSPLAGNTLVVYVSKSGSTSGMPYFQYDGKFYTWGNNIQSAIDGHAITANVCFNTEASYQVRLQASSEEGDCNQYRYKALVNGYWRTNYTSCPKGYTEAKGNCVKYCSGTLRNPYLVAKGEREEMDGNFLNWYFSDTIAEWADNSLDGGFKEYVGSDLDHGFWTERAATRFITTQLNFATSGNSVKPSNTQINNSNKNANNKYWFPDIPVHSDKTYSDVAKSWLSGEHAVFDSSDSHNHSSPETSMMGMKPGVSYFHMRINVAIDVGKKVIRDMDNAFLAISDFWASINSSGNEVSKGSQRQLIHGFVEIDTRGKPEQTAANKQSLLNAMGAIAAEGGTPTASTLTAAARYIFQGYEDSKFQYKYTASADVEEVKVSDIMDRTFVNLSTEATPPFYDDSKKNISKELWCQKNAIAILTDGAPSGDGSASKLRASRKNYLPRGVSSVPSGDHSHLIRVAGALYDHDFMPEWPGKQNIETFMIAMGSREVISNPNFITAGRAGGGGKENFYAASNGSAITQAFKDIVARIQSSAASITAIAVSSVSEMKTDNFAVQATYETEYWNSKLKAFRLNKQGQFINSNASVDSEGSDSSAGIEPVWEANELMNKLYLIDGPRKRSVKQRKVYTWKPEESKGIPFASTNMVRPNSPAASFPAFNNLPVDMRNDLRMATGDDAQEQYDLMMYLLGDISHEEALTLSSSDRKWRTRGQYVVENNKVIDVLAGGFLGDIADSSPVYVKEPPRPWDDKNFAEDERRYSSYKEQLKDRTAMVYVGSNRGFLHGFAVEGSRAGEEIFAYMPNALSSIKSREGYHYLANRGYEHRFYVDLTPTVSDVYMDFYSQNTEASPEWRTILIGGLRAGGKGYFALDVTCPFQTSNTGSTCDNESFSERNVLWEFTDKDDEDLGYSFGEPVIAKVFYDTGELDSGRNGNGQGRWAAIISNGYNSINGRAVLFVLFLDGGLDGNWVLGRDYIKLYAGDEFADNSSSKNGLSSATAIDLTGDGIVDYIYAGDVKGQMWSFNVSQSVVYQED